MMFSNQPEALIEIVPPGFDRKTFCFLLSFELGASFSCLQALEAPTFAGQLAYWQGSNDPRKITNALYVPPSKLSELLLEQPRDC